MKRTSQYLFKRYIAQASTMEDFVIDVDHAEGVYVWDKQGKKYIDFISSICVNNVGHRHPHVMEAIRHQMDKYLHVMVYGEFIQQPQLELAEMLCNQLPPQLQKVFFVNSGSEAIEGAIKLARLYNHRPEIVSFKNSYHGSTMGAMSVLGNVPIQDAFRPLLPEHRMLTYNCEQELDLITGKTCCVVAEAIQAGAGMNTPKNDFLKKLKRRCEEVGALLIFDEIQTGFGRTSKLFAFMNYEVVPDVLCIAKGMGAGMPVSAFIASEPLMDLLNNEHPLLGHASTFGGHPLSCVAAKAGLEVILREELLPKVEAKEQRIRRHLEELGDAVEVRGKGLFLGVDFKDEELCRKVMFRCMKKGLITLYLLFNHTTLGMTPPLTIRMEEIDEAMNILKSAYREIISENEKS